MTKTSIYITEGLRFFFKSLKSRFIKQKYTGTAKQICRQIVQDCWNGHYFQTSNNGFSQFWTRDFGWCTKSLIQLGYQKEVHQTIRYALNRFQQVHRITTSITPKGTPYNFPEEAVDSLPYLIHSIKIAKFPYYSFKAFLNQQIRIFYQTFIDPVTGLIKPELHPSSMKDFSIRKSSCYDNTLVALLAKDLKELKLDNPFVKHDYPKLLKQHFWNGKYFYDDLTKREYVAGDANVFPFALGIISDKEMMESALNEIQKAQLDNPFPLKYTNQTAPVKFVWQEFFFKNYERDSIWLHMGPLYVKLLKRTNPELAKQHQQTYTELIHKHHNFLEVFHPNQKPYSSFYYYCDSSMLWAANYLTL